MSEKDGGPAFPIQGYGNGLSGGGNVIHHEGMKLRDYFAAQITTGLFASDSHSRIATQIRAQSDRMEMSLSVSDVAQQSAKEIARLVYEIADAMLAERAKS